MDRQTSRWIAGAAAEVSVTRGGPWYAAPISNETLKCLLRGPNCQSPGEASAGLVDRQLAGSVMGSAASLT